MKGIIAFIVLGLISALFWTTHLYAAPAPEGFVGLPWGASRNQIMEKMNAQGWIKLSGRSPDEAIFKGSFDGNACELHFVMAGNSLVKGYATPIARFPVRDNSATRYVYESIVRHLTEKYGPQTDGGEGPGIAMTVWEFGDGVTTDKYKIEVMFNKEGTWFSDVDGEYTYIQVDYTALTLSERLKKQNL